MPLYVFRRFSHPPRLLVRDQHTPSRHGRRTPFSTLDDVSTTTQASPVTDASSLLKLNAPPKYILCLVRLAALLMGTSEGEPCFGAIPAGAELGDGGEKSTGAIAGGEAVDKGETRGFVGDRELVIKKRVILCCRWLGCDEAEGYRRKG